jgi:hypothetical protein
VWWNFHPTNQSQKTTHHHTAEVKEQHSNIPHAEIFIAAFASRDMWDFFPPLLGAPKLPLLPIRAKQPESERRRRRRNNEKKKVQPSNPKQESQCRIVLSSIA